MFPLLCSSLLFNCDYFIGLSCSFPPMELPGTGSTSFLSLPALQHLICWRLILVKTCLTNIPADNKVSASVLFKLPSSFSLPETAITHKLFQEYLETWVSG